MDKAKRVSPVATVKWFRPEWRKCQSLQFQILRSCLGDVAVESWKRVFSGALARRELGGSISLSKVSTPHLCSLAAETIDDYFGFGGDPKVKTLASRGCAPSGWKLRFVPESESRQLCFTTRCMYRRRCSRDDHAVVTVCPWLKTLFFSHRLGMAHIGSLCRVFVCNPGRVAGRSLQAWQRWRVDMS